MFIFISSANRALSAASAAANAIRESGILNNRPSGRRPSNTRPRISRPSVSRPRPTPRRNIITRPSSNTVSNIRSNAPRGNSNINNARPAPISTSQTVVSNKDKVIEIIIDLVGKLVEEIEQDICDAVNGGTAVSGSLGDVCEENVDTECSESQPCFAVAAVGVGGGLDTTSGIVSCSYLKF